MAKRILVALVGAVAGFLIGSLAAQWTGWRWWVRICTAIAPAEAVLIAERKRFIRTQDELRRPITLFSEDDPHGRGEDRTPPLSR